MEKKILIQYYYSIPKKKLFLKKTFFLNRSRSDSEAILCKIFVFNEIQNEKYKNTPQKQKENESKQNIFYTPHKRLFFIYKIIIRFTRKFIVVEIFEITFYASYLPLISRVFYKNENQIMFTSKMRVSNELVCLSVCQI